MSDDGCEYIDAVWSEWDVHRVTCRHCTFGSACKIGKRLLREAAKEAERRLGNVMAPTAKA